MDANIRQSIVRARGNTHTSSLERLRSRLLGFDIFISYAHDDSLGYAMALESLLTASDLACFRDAKELPVGINLKETIQRALAKSKMLIVIVTGAAVKSAWVRDELTQFARTKRPMIAIKVGETGIPPEWSFLGDSVYVSETSANVRQAQPCNEVLDRIYQAISFRRCNTTGRRLLGVTLATFVGLGILLALQYAQTLSERKRAFVERTEAEKLIDYIVVDLKKDLKPLGKTALLKKAATEALGYFEAARSGQTDVERLKLNWRAVNNLAEVQIEIGEVKEARVTRENLVKLARRIKQSDPTSPMLAQSYRLHGAVLAIQNELEQARESYELSLELAQTAVEKNPDNTGMARILIGLHTQMAALSKREGEPTNAIAWHKKNIEFYDKLYSPENPRLWSKDKLATYNSMIGLYMEQGNLDEATSLCDKARRIALRRYESSPDDLERQRDLSVIFDKFGHLQLRKGKPADAVDWYTKSLEIAEALAAHDPDNGRWQNDLASSLDYLGDAYLQQEYLDRGEKVYQRALDIRRQLSERHPENQALRRSLSIGYHKIGKVFYRLKRYQRAIEFFQESQSVFKKRGAISNSDVETRGHLAINYRMLAVTYHDLGELAQAHSACQNAMTIVGKLFKSEPGDWQKRVQELEPLCERLSHEIESKEN